MLRPVRPWSASGELDHTRVPAEGHVVDGPGTVDRVRNVVGRAVALLELRGFRISKRYVPVTVRMHTLCLKVPCAERFLVGLFVDSNDAEEPSVDSFGAAVTGQETTGQLYS